MPVGLPGLDPSIGQYTKVDLVSPHVKEVIAAEMARQRDKEKRTKLTWTSPEDGWAKRGAKGAAKFVGMPIGTDGFDKKLPWMSYNGIFFVQNCRYYLSNGDQITEEQIPATPIPFHVCALCQYRTAEEGGACSIREVMQRQMASYRAQALSVDPMLCKYCFEHTADSPDEYAEHLAIAHPDKLGQRLGLGSATPGPSPSSPVVPSSSEGTAEVTPPPPPPPSFDVPRGTTTMEAAGPIPVSLTRTGPILPPPIPGMVHLCTVDRDGKACGREFNRQPDLKRHQTTVHKIRG